jgi:long-chain fatty acid transport protein
LGLTVSRIEGLLSAGVAPLPSNPTLEVNGDDISYSYNFGVLWQIAPQSRIGFDYRSKTDYNLAGTSEVKNLPVTGFMQTYDASLDISTPATFELSLAHQLNPDVNVTPVSL